MQKGLSGQVQEVEWGREPEEATQSPYQDRLLEAPGEVRVGGVQRHGVTLEQTDIERRE